MLIGLAGWPQQVAAQPQIAVSPASLSATLATGEQETQTLTVTNEGTEQLAFTVTLTTPAAREAAATAEALLALATEPLATPADPVRGTYAPRATGGVYADSLHYDNPTGYVQAYYYTAPTAVRFNPEAAFTLTAVRAWLQNVSSVMIDVHAFSQPSNPTSGPLLLSTVVEVPEGGPLKELPLGASLAFEAGERFFVVLRPLDMDGLVGATQSGPPGGASFWYNNASGWSFVSDRWVIRALSSAGGELFSVSPMEGSIAPGGSTDVDVTFDASGVFAGTYERLITFHSNDPGNPGLPVPATLTVGGQPLISVTPAQLDFGEVFVGYSDTLEVAVVNVGSEPLQVASLTSTQADFTAIPAEGFTLQPAQQRRVRVAFTPSTDGDAVAELTLASNDPNAPSFGIPLAGAGVLPPAMVLTPSELSSELDSGQTETLTLTVTNEGPGVLDFDFAGYDTGNRAAGGPDAFGHRWIDSNQPGGPFYDWVDITASGIDLELGRHDVEAVELPFPFPFYGEMRDTLYVYSHGVLSFELTDPPSRMFFPKPLPHADGPNALIAPMWLELAPDHHGTVYAGLDGLGRFVITYHQVRGFWQDDSYYTFQAILSPDGTILFQYDDIQGIRGHRASIGIENDDASTGLGVVYREAYVHDGLAVQISTTPSWITSVSPASGTLAPGQSETLSVVFDAGDLGAGLYTDILAVNSNDPEQHEAIVPVSLSVDGGGGNLRASLDAGWNLFSTNLAFEDASVPHVMAGLLDRLEVVASYQGGAWLSWRPDAGPEENTLAVIDPMYSYWVKLSAPGFIHLSGTPIELQTQIQLDAGTNAIPYLPSRAHMLDHALESVMGMTTAAMSFTGTGLLASPDVPPEFQVLSQMWPKMGYVVRTSAPATLVYPTEGAGPDSEPGDIPRPTLGGIIATEAEAEVTPTPEWMGIWGGNVVLADGSPLPVGTLVTARTEDGLTVGAFRTVAEGRIGLMSVYRDDRFTEEKDGATQGETVSLYVGSDVLTTFPWTELGDIVDVSNLTVDTEPIPGGAAPLAYALEQNYPNPFNPQTTIRFALPEAGMVTVRVYDLLGRLVATLVEGDRPAGWHEVLWDASGVASGVYVHRLEAGDFSQTHRMILLR